MIKILSKTRTTPKRKKRIIRFLMEKLSKLQLGSYLKKIRPKPVSLKMNLLNSVIEPLYPAGYLRKKKKKSKSRVNYASVTTVTDRTNLNQHNW
jgi:hypothetical protein